MTEENNSNQNKVSNDNPQDEVVTEGSPAEKIEETTNGGVGSNISQSEISAFKNEIASVMGVGETISMPARTMAMDAERAQNIDAERAQSRQQAREELESLLANPNREQGGGAEKTLEEAFEQTPAEKSEPLITEINQISDSQEISLETEKQEKEVSEEILKEEIVAAPVIGEIETKEVKIESETKEKLPSLEEELRKQKEVEKGKSQEDEEVTEPTITTSEVDPSVDPRVAALKEQIADIKKEQLSLEEKRKTFTDKERPIQREIEQASIKKEGSENRLTPFLEEEAKIEQEIKKLQEEEAAQTEPKARHAIESKRWELEDKRHEIEKKKWEVQKELEEIMGFIEKQNTELDEIRRSSSVIDAKIKSGENRIVELDLEIELVDISDKKEEIELEWIKNNEEKDKLESKLRELQIDEERTESEIGVLERQEKEAGSSQEQREVEKKRQELSLQRREVEKNRWGIEQDLRKIELTIDQLKPSYQQALTREEEMYRQLEKLRSVSSNDQS